MASAQGSGPWDTFRLSHGTKPTQLRPQQQARMLPSLDFPFQCPKHASFWSLTLLAASRAKGIWRAGATGRIYLRKSHHRPAHAMWENEGLGPGTGSEEYERAGVNILSANSKESALLVPLSARVHASLHLCSGPAVTSIWILGSAGKLSSKFVPSSAATQQKKTHMEMAELAGI